MTDNIRNTMFGPNATFGRTYVDTQTPNSKDITVTKRFELPKSLVNVAKTQKGQEILKKAQQGIPQTMEEHDADIFPKFPENNYEEHQYLSLLEHILENGQYKGDRTGVGCYSVFGEMMRFDLKGGKIPLLTTKKMGIKSIIAELLWFLEGSTDNRRLNELGATIWDEWALENGDLGPIYGKWWTAWEVVDNHHIETTLHEALNDLNSDKEIARARLSGLLEYIKNPPKINQIQELVTALKENPTSRRMLVTAWNPAVLPRDVKWEYNWLDPMAATEAVHTRWEPMSFDQRADWLWETKGIGNGVFEEDYLEEYNAPTHRRRVKVSPQDNVKEGRAALPACHTMFQVHTRELSVDERLNIAERTVSDGVALDEMFELAICGLVDDDKEVIQRELVEKLDAVSVPKRALTLQFYARSQDTPLGTPYNIASYAILAHMLAQSVGMVAEECIWMGGDCHIYSNQLEGVKVQLEREPRSWPTIKLNPDVKDIFSFTTEDIELIGYEPHPKIDFGPVAI